MKIKRVLTMFVSGFMAVCSVMSPLQSNKLSFTSYAEDSLLERLIMPDPNYPESDYAESEYYDKSYNVNSATVKPKISIAVEGVDKGKVYTCGEAAGREIICELKVSGAQNNYSLTGIHVYYSNRLEIVENENRKVATKGSAIDNTAPGAPKELNNLPIRYKGFFVCTGGEGDCGLDGTMWTFKLKVPNDARVGEVFPIDIIYESGDIFMNDNKDKLMQMYAFTKGIYNSRYNCNFKANSLDIYNCNTLNKIAGYYDGYIAVADSDSITVKHGKCGEDTSYDLDKNGVLTISGNGEMYDWSSMENIPWYNERNNIKKIIIKDGVTRIGKLSFKECSANSVEIANTVKTIGANAFNYCYKLNSVVIPDSVELVDTGSFSDCKKLETVTISNGVKKIGDSVFNNCASLKEVIILEPKCEINESGLWDIGSYNGVVKGYEGSTAQAYAKKTHISFVKLEKERIVSYGDPTGDDKIDSKDATFILVEYSSLATGGESALTAEEKSAADINKDGKIDSKDASTILSYYSYCATGGKNDIIAYVEETLHIIISQQASTTTTSTSTETTETTTRVPNKAPDDYVEKDIEFSIIENDYDFVPVQPKLTINVDGDEKGKVFDLADVAGKEITCSMSISGTNKKYSATGISIGHDNRLELIKYNNGKEFVTGDALINFDTGFISSSYQKDAINNMSLLFIATAGGEGEYGLDGTMCYFKVKIPENAKKGDVYPIDISYGFYEEGEGGCFRDEDDKKFKTSLTEIYLFSKGIYNMRYNCNFIAKESDFEKCHALADIPGCYDGYIAIAD